MLGRIHIDNYRCFSNFELRPDRVNLLLGANGSGKSSLVEVLTAIVRLVRTGLEVGDLFPASTLTRWDSRLEQRFELELDLDGDAYSYSLRVEQEGEARRTAIAEERVTLAGRTLFAFVNGTVHLHNNDGKEGTSFPFRPTRSFLAEMQPRAENTALMKLLDHLNRTRVLKLIPSAMGSVSHEESSSLRSDGANIASWYRHIAQENPAALHELFSRLQGAIPGFQSLALTGAGNQGRTRDLVAKCIAPASNPFFVDFADLSDGQRVLVVLYTLLLDLRTGAGLVLLDEPDNYVSLREIQPWLAALDDALGDDGQLLLISHHPEVINYLAPERPLLFTREAGGPVRVVDPGFDREQGLQASEQIARGWLDVG